MKTPRIVYALKHEATGKMYIGSTANVKKRYQVHCSQLKYGKHPAKKLQTDYDQHENKELTLMVLDEITKGGESGKEYEWMARYQTTDPEKGYNYADPKLPTSPSHARCGRKRKDGTR